MNNFLRSCALGLLCVLSSCHGPQPDEKLASATVQKELSLSGTVTAQKLHGGLSDSMLFLATDGKKNYVIRFIRNSSSKQRNKEIYNLTVASNGGYGPKIYFADPSKGIVIMEYLPGTTPSDKDLKSDRLYVELAHLLQKIHQGPAFKGQYDPFKRIDRSLRRYKTECSAYIPLAKVEQILNRIHHALLPHLTKTPCHNDLHPGNLMFLGNEIKAIDYADAGSDDPYFDIATVAAAPYFDSTPPALQKLLLSTYLEHEPSAVEEAKLYLMKQVVFLKWGVDSLDRLTPKDAHQYALLKDYGMISVPPLGSKFDLDSPEDNVRHMKMLFTLVFENAETREFTAAVNLLSTSSKEHPEIQMPHHSNS